MARIAVAVALAGAIVLMIIAGVISLQYEPSPVIITILGAIVLTLLGLEARDLLKGGQ